MEQLTFGPFARSNTQGMLENAFTRLLHCIKPVEYSAAVDVHVLFHALEQGRVGGDLDRRSRLAAEHAATTSREADEVGAAGHLPRGGNRIVARRIHEDEAAFVGTGSAYGMAAQRFVLPRPSP